MTSCEGCYAKEIMEEKRQGCLYMYKQAYNRLYKSCPCSDCFLKCICRYRYKQCDVFHEFINEGIVVETKESILEK